MLPCLLLAVFPYAEVEAAELGTIDRHALVTRHNVVLTNADARQVLQVGNGEFAFGADVTGLQTFLPAHTPAVLILAWSADIAVRSAARPGPQADSDAPLCLWTE